MSDRVSKRDEVKALLTVGLTLAGQGMNALSDVLRKAAQNLENAAHALDAQPPVQDAPAEAPRGPYDPPRTPPTNP